MFESPMFGEKLTDEKSYDFEMSGNGYVKGNFIFLTPTRQRYKEHYLRITAPIGNCHKNEENFDESVQYSGEKIIIALGGGVFYDSHDNIAVACEVVPPIIFSQFRQEYNYLGIKFVAAYLKSSVAIWYAERCLGSSDVWRKDIVNRIPIPKNVDPVSKEKAEKLLDQIISQEYEFLRAEKELMEKLNTDGSMESLELLMNEHNSAANLLVNDLDILFYQFFNFNEKEISIIEQVLRACNLAVFRDASKSE